jgi:predicted AAA+ superfamily ATPase
LGRFILTGSSQFELLESVTQSLAGRASLMTLLPFSLAELQAVNQAPTSVDELLFQGLFPPVHVRPVDTAIWLQDYVSTYVERDVRQMLKVQDLATFQRFVQLCAGRVGQLLNVSSLANDAGVTRVTADAWLSVLQASHLLVLVRPWFSNVAKRLIKTPKLYFVDPGLAGWLMGIRQQGHLAAHPQRGALFENWVMTELWKAQTHAGHRATLHFLRDKQGQEVDAWVETGLSTYQAVEIKAGETVVSDYFKGLDYWREHLPKLEVHSWVVHGGSTRQQRTRGTVLPWNGLTPLLKRVAGEA